MVWYPLSECGFISGTRKSRLTVSDTASEHSSTTGLCWVQRFPKYPHPAFWGSTGSTYTFVRFYCIHIQTFEVLLYPHPDFFRFYWIHIHICEVLLYPHPDFWGSTVSTSRFLRFYCYKLIQVTVTLTSKALTYNSNTKFHTKTPILKTEPKVLLVELFPFFSPSLCYIGQQTPLHKTRTVIRNAPQHSLTRHTRPYAKKTKPFF